MMLFSGCVHSQEAKLPQGTTLDGIYYEVGYKEGSGNLFVGGILQDGPNPEGNDPCLRIFADQNQAIYVPTYYSTGLTPLIERLPMVAM